MMAELTPKELMRELHQGMYGIKDTEDKGLIGDMKFLTKLVLEQNGRTRKNSRLIYIMYGVMAASGLGFGINFFVG